MKPGGPNTIASAQRPDLPSAGVAVPRPMLRIDLPGGARIGPGKIALLEAVGETGSITSAGKALGMSYRRAWLLLDALNHTFDSPVVATTAGGVHGGGAQVTDFGRSLIVAYRDLEAACAALTEERLAAFAVRLAPEPPVTDTLSDD